MPRSLDRVALREKNRNAPDGQRFCNGLCFDYIPRDRFSAVHVICNQCRNVVSMAEKKIRKNQITLEQFHTNPMIVYHDQQSLDIQTRKKCDTCDQEKLITQFEFQRHTCKSCRYLQASARNKQALQGYIHDIEQLKTNIPMLTNFLRNIQKDCLILVVSHYHVGRKATDNKAAMVQNLLNYFMNLTDPSKCRYCKTEITPPQRICGECQKKHPTTHTYDERQEFIKTIGKTLHDLKPLDPEKDMDLFTRQELVLLNREAGLKFNQQIIKKHGLFMLLNDFLKTREEQRQKQHAEEILQQKQIIVQPKSFDDLIIDQFVIQAREKDGFINATQLCKAGGKRFFNWFQLEQTSVLIEVLHSETGIPASQLVDIKKGHSDKFQQGSWIHPDLAVQLAQWISPKFGVKVSRWVREILMTGKTEIQDKPHHELIRLQIELQKEQDIRKRLEMNHKKLLYKREYHKFQKGPCFYIIHADTERFKIGYDGTDINERFRAYRTSIPHMRVCFMVFTPHADLLEKCLLLRFKDSLVETNHEFLTTISLLELTTTIDTLLNYCKIPYEKVSDEEIHRYHES